jgi:hypothetical protein
MDCTHLAEVQGLKSFFKQAETSRIAVDDVRLFSLLFPLFSSVDTGISRKHPAAVLVHSCSFG